MGASSGQITNLQQSILETFNIYGPYSQQIIFFATYESVQSARLLHNIRLQGVSNDKNSNLLVQFICYDEKEVLWKLAQGLYSYIFFVTYELAQ